MCAIHRCAVHNFNVLWDMRSSLLEYGCPVPACPDMIVIFLTFTLFRCFLQSHIILRGNFVPQTVGVLRPISAKYFIKCAISYKAGDGKGKKNEDTSFIFQVELIKNSSSLQKENVWKIKATTSWGFQVKSLQFICTTPCAVGMKCWALENLLQQSWKQWNMLKRPWTGSYCNFNQFFELQRVSMSCEETHSPPSWRWKWGTELLWVK